MHFANCVALAARQVAIRKFLMGKGKSRRGKTFLFTLMRMKKCLYWYYTRIHLFMNS